MVPTLCKGALQIRTSPALTGPLSSHEELVSHWATSHRRGGREVGGLLSDLSSLLADRASPWLQAGYVSADSKAGSLALRVGQPLNWTLGTLDPGGCQTRAGDRRACR